jgi:ketosteroid isomerase-like protein
MDLEYSAHLLQAVKAATTEASDHQSILYQVYSAVVEGNFDAIHPLLTEDVELNICGFPPMDGAWRGQGEVVKAIRRNFGLVDAQQPEVERILTHGDSVIVLVRESGVIKASEEAYSVRCVQWLTFEGGKIRKIEEIAASVGSR